MQAPENALCARVRALAYMHCAIMHALGNALCARGRAQVRLFCVRGAEWRVAAGENWIWKPRPNQRGEHKAMHLRAFECD